MFGKGVNLGNVLKALHFGWEKSMLVFKDDEEKWGGIIFRVLVFPQKPVFTFEPFSGGVETRDHPYLKEMRASKNPKRIRMAKVCEEWCDYGGKWRDVADVAFCNSCSALTNPEFIAKESVVLTTHIAQVDPAFMNRKHNPTSTRYKIRASPGSRS
jgi:hypothetical protein